MRGHFKEPRHDGVDEFGKYYSTLSEAYGTIVTWIIENGYEIAGAPFDLYIKTQFDFLPPKEWETEVYFPVRKK